jgi:hypothetical protein
LVAAVLAQHPHRVPVEGDRPGAGGRLGLAFDDLVAGGGAVTGHEQHPVVEVDLAPAQPAHLTAAKPA